MLFQRFRDIRYLLCVIACLAVSPTFAQDGLDGGIRSATPQQKADSAKKAVGYVFKDGNGKLRVVMPVEALNSESRVIEEEGIGDGLDPTQGLTDVSRYPVDSDDDAGDDPNDDDSASEPVETAGGFREPLNFEIRGEHGDSNAPAPSERATPLGFVKWGPDGKLQVVIPLESLSGSQVSEASDALSAESRAFTTCTKCSGTGRYVRGFGFVRCDRCGGDGRVKDEPPF